MSILESMSRDDLDNALRSVTCGLIASSLAAECDRLARREQQLASEYSRRGMFDRYQRLADRIVEEAA